MGHELILDLHHRPQPNRRLCVCAGNESLGSILCPALAIKEEQLHNLLRHQKNITENYAYLCHYALGRRCSLLDL